MSFVFDHILAIDASTESLHLAVSFGEDRLVKSSDELGRRHGQMLFRKLEQVMESATISQADLSGIVVCTGPGSFTGLRVAIAAMKGIAMVRRIPIVGISLFDLLAWSQFETLSPQLAVTRLTRDEYATVVFANRKVDMTTLRIGLPQELLSTVPNIPTWLINLPRAVETSQLPPQIRHFDYDASLLLAYGKEMLESGVSHDLHSLEPLYLQASTAERNWAARQQQA